MSEYDFYKRDHNDPFTIIYDLIKESDKSIYGSVQVFKNGQACYWKANSGVKLVNTEHDAKLLLISSIKDK